MTLTIETYFDYELAAPSDILLQLEAAARADQKILAAHIDVRTPEHFTRVAGEDGIGERIWIRAEGRLTCTYSATVAIDRPRRDIGRLAQVPTHRLPGEMVKYLMAPRYCESDDFQYFVANEFGPLAGGARIVAIRDWIEKSFQYVPGSSNSRTTASDSFVQRQGICRDFAHVMVTLARASAIPARMANVYAPDIDPPDFHAVAEVYLEGSWHLIDATGMASADRMAIIGVGRDAADIAFLTSYGDVRLKTISVSALESDRDVDNNDGNKNTGN